MSGRVAKYLKECLVCIACWDLFQKIAFQPDSQTGSKSCQQEDVCNFI